MKNVIIVETILTDIFYDIRMTKSMTKIIFNIESKHLRGSELCSQPVSIAPYSTRLMASVT